jgi:hypothetical protein
MKTYFIGIKEFRENMTKISKKFEGKKVRFIVMNHLRPMFEAYTIADKEALKKELLAEKII